MADITYKEATEGIPSCTICGWVATGAWNRGGLRHARRELLRHLRDEHAKPNEHLDIEAGPEIVEVSCVDCDDLGAGDWSEAVDLASGVTWAINHAREEQHEVNVNWSRDLTFHGELIKR